MPGRYTVAVAVSICACLLVTAGEVQGAARSGVVPTKAARTAVDTGAKPSPAPEQPPAPEQDDDEKEADDNWKYNVGAQTEINSRLVWRGLAESRGAVMQPEAWAGLYGLTFSAWSSFILSYEAPRDRFSLSAADLALGYVYTLDRVRVEPTIAYFYWSPDLAPQSTAEVGLEISYKLGDFRLVSGNNVDVKRRPGAYYGTVGAKYARTSRQWTVKAFMDLGWATAAFNDEYLARDMTTVNLIEAGASARYDVTDVLYFALHTELTSLASLTLQRSVQEPTLVVGGMAFGAEY